MTVNAELYTISILKLCGFERICSKYCYKNSHRIHNKKKYIYIISKYTVGFFIIQIKFISTMKIHIVVCKDFPVFSFLSC